MAAHMESKRKNKKKSIKKERMSAMFIPFFLMHKKIGNVTFLISERERELIKRQTSQKTVTSTMTTTSPHSRKRKQSVLDDYFVPKKQKNCLKDSYGKIVVGDDAKKSLLNDKQKHGNPLSVKVNDRESVASPVVILDDDICTSNSTTTTTKTNRATLQSGAAPGADSIFHEMAKKHNHNIKNFVFSGEQVEVKENLVYLSLDQLATSKDALEIAAKDMQRNIQTRNQYVYNLLRRNYFQILNSTAVFAVSEFEPRFHPPTESKSVRIRGGTAWACQMFANRHKKFVRANKIPLYLYSEIKGTWLQCRIESNGLYSWTPLEEQPKLPTNCVYTGIGSREIGPDGEAAIKKLYEAV